MNLFSYLKTRVTILDVISEYATLKKAGLYWKGQCPFHQEKTASFTVSPHKEIFYCFGCQAGGDVISFIARMENCSQFEAARHLIERYQIELPSSVSADLQSEAPDQKHYYLVCHLFAQWAHEQLFKSPQAMDYLISRNITIESIKHFGIGYFPGGLANIKRCTAELGKQHILVDDLLQAHLISRGKNVLFSSFEERILFPITDHLGRSCGFGGRIFRKDDARPKYYNSHESELFQKGSLLFGLDRAKKEIQKQGIVYLVEGYTDCVAMAQHGYANTVATLGTACTLEHLTVLSRYAQHLYIVYDGDNAGSQAMLRVGQLCWQANIELKVVCLPKGSDPASFLQQKNDLTPLISQADDIFTFFIKTLGSNFNTKPLAEKMELTGRILEMITKVSQPLKQDILLGQASAQLGIPFDSLKKELTYLGQGRPRPKSSPKAAAAPLKSDLASPADVPATALENTVFYAILNNIQFINAQNEEFLVNYLPHPLCDILKKLQDEKGKRPDLGFIQFFELLDEPERQLVSQTLLATEQDITPTLFDQLMVQLQKKHWKMIVHSVRTKLETAKLAGDQQEVDALMHYFTGLKKKILGNIT